MRKQATLMHPVSTTMTAQNTSFSLIQDFYRFLQT